MTQQTQRHEQTQSSRATFTNHVKHMINTMEEKGNPCMEEAKELMRLDTRHIIDPAVIASIETGKQQYDSFITDHLFAKTTPIAEPIKKNKLPLLSPPTP